MAETNVNVRENTPESVAFQLMEIIRNVERRHESGKGNPDRQWILQTYAQCLETVRTPEFVRDHLGKFSS